jgi:hypothetical protein
LVSSYLLRFCHLVASLYLETASSSFPSGPHPCSSTCLSCEVCIISYSRRCVSTQRSHHIAVLWDIPFKVLLLHATSHDTSRIPPSSLRVTRLSNSSSFNEKTNLANNFTVMSLQKTKTWGFKVPGRPTTPCEGAAQVYQRSRSFL